MSLKNRVKLKIGGTEIVVLSEESEEYVSGIGQEVDRRIKSQVTANPHLSFTTAAVLTALDLCDECRKATAAQDNLRVQMKNYLEDSARLKIEADDAQRQVEMLKKEIRELRQRLNGR